MSPMKQNQNWDAIVVGGGIAGLGVARALALKKKKVLILEKPVSGAASPHASGILDPFVDLDFRSEILALTLPSVKKYPQWIRQIESATGLQTGYQKMDLLYVAFSAREEKQLRGFLKVSGFQKKISMEWLTGDVVREIEPDISSKVCAGLRLHGVARVIPSRLMRALRAWLKKQGVAFLEIGGNPELLVEKGRTVGIRFGSRSFKAAQVVGCLGAWAGAMSKSSFFHEPVEPVRGQVVIYARQKPLRVLLHTVDGGYLIPWTKGRILAGSTVEQAGFTPQVTAQGKKKIHRYAERILPRLANRKPVQQWAGLRPRSVSRVPRIGKTRISGYYVANGYYRCGILIGLYAGELLAQVMESGKNPPELRPFSKM